MFGKGLAIGYKKNGCVLILRCYNFKSLKTVLIETKLK